MSETSLHTNEAAPLSVVRRLPPEDIRVGDDVALYEITCQVPSFMWCGADPITLPVDRPVRLTYLASDHQIPLKVKSICLPLVLCELPEKKHRVFDVRQVQLVRVDPEFATQVRKAFSSRKKVKKRKRKGE